MEPCEKTPDSGLDFFDLSKSFKWYGTRPKLSQEAVLPSCQASESLPFENKAREDNGVSFRGEQEKEVFKVGYNSLNKDKGAEPKSNLTFLPIDREKDRILHCIDANQVTVVTGVTGCGKTTRVPQYIFDHCLSENRFCNIIVTQPRRIAAQSIAKRICDERGVTLGDLVGYKVGFDRENVSENTKILFCTTGILLKMLVNQKNTHEWTHIILDEVHERDIDLDFSLLLIKKFIFSNSRGTKLILMSASCDPYPLQKYFSWEMNSFKDIAVHIEVGGSQTPFRVNEYFSCNKDMIRAFKCKDIGPSLKKPDPKLFDECIILCRKIIENLDYIEEYSGNPGAVLVFLPGENEIQIVRDHLIEYRSKDVKCVWKLLPLHSRIPSDGKDLIFKNFNHDKNSPQNIRKIILSTNMAESSITIPDIVYVIDFCLTKNLRADKSTNYVALRLEWADKSNLKQRKGRAGRVAEGRVYRLISHEFYDQCLDEAHDPEILRAPLEKVILDTKLLDEGSPRDILKLALSPPDLTNVYKSVMHLKEIGALLTTVKGVEKREDGDLTTLGEIVASLPVDVRMGKLIVLGHIFNVLNESIIIAAGMAHNSIFVNSFDNKVKSYEYKLRWSDGTFSDGIAIKLAYEKWRNVLNSGRFKGIERDNEELKWCRSNFLELKALRDMHSTIRDIQTSLSHKGINIYPRPNVKRKTEHQKYLLIRIVIFGAFYPNYFIQSQNLFDSNEVNRSINGKDHRSTLFLSGFPTDQALYAPLYYGQIRNFFNSFIPADENFQIQVEGSKVLISFNKRSYESLIDKQCIYQLNGTVLQQVLMGIKLRKIQRESFKLFIYPQDRAMTEYRKYQEKLTTGYLYNDGVHLSELGHFDVLLEGNFTTVNIVHINDPNSFYVHFIETNFFGNLHSELLDSIKKLTLNNPHYVQSMEECRFARLYLAQYTDGLGETSFCRCKLQRLSKESKCVEVFFIDYGSTSSVQVGDLIKVTRQDAQKCPSILKVPPMAVESTLSFVKPNPIQNKHMSWSSAAINAFKAKIGELPLDVKVQVYSVIQKSGGEPLASLELISEKDQISINDWIKTTPPNSSPYGDYSNESYLSEENHRNGRQYRQRLRESSCIVSENYDIEHLSNVLSCDERKVVYLKGPFHPLESSLKGLHSLASSKLINIAPESVNSVLLQQFPNEAMDLWVVAGLVNLKPSGDGLSIRSTNFMPAIPGFGSIMSMIFGPKIELRCNKGRTRLTGAIVGLGDRPANWNTKDSNHRFRVPYHKDHDMEIEFDALIDMDDIEYINKIRFSINYLLSREQPMGAADSNIQVKPRFVNPYFLEECQDNIEKYLDYLMSKSRKSIEKHPCSKAFRWNLIPQEYVIKASDVRSLKGYLKPIDGIELKSKSEEELMANELRGMALAISTNKLPSYTKEMRCPLCPGGDIFQDYSLLYDHCQGMLHIYRESNFWMNFRKAHRSSDLKIFEDISSGRKSFEGEVYCPLCPLRPCFYSLDKAFVHSLNEAHLKMKDNFLAE